MAASLIVLGDIHVSTRGRPTADALRIVAHAAQLRPQCVVLLGDATSGNKDDGHSTSDVRAWWHALREALAPLREAGIPVLPIAGNHDYYTAAHKKGYAEAWADLAGEVAPLPLSGQPPLSYACDLDDVHLSLCHLVDQHLDDDTAAWLEADLRGAAAARARLCFGHVPLQSAIGHTAAGFRTRMVQLLGEGRADAYFCGHEHLYWDEVLTEGGSQVLQVIAGTPGASYTYPLRRELAGVHVHGGHGLTPGCGVRFAVDPHTRLQARRAVFLQVQVDEGGVHVRPFCLGPGGELADLHEPA